MIVRMLLPELKLLRERMGCVKQGLFVNQHIEELADTEIWSQKYLTEIWEDFLSHLEEQYPRTHSRESFIEEWEKICPRKKPPSSDE